MSTSNDAITTHDDSNEGLAWLRGQLRWEATLDTLRSGDTGTVTALATMPAPTDRQPVAA